MNNQSLSRRMLYLLGLLLILNPGFGGIFVDTVRAAQPRGRADASPPIGGETMQADNRMERIHAATAVHRRQHLRLLEIKDVLGSGIGLGSNREPVIKVFTSRHGVIGIPDTLEGVPIITEVSGPFYARRGETCDAKSTTSDGVCTNAERWPLPVPTGVSIGHPDITAGTIGARVTNGDRTKVYVLSNNHVLAKVNQANIGDFILQPGAFDDGLTPGDAVATLTAFEPIKFCEVFWIWVFCDDADINTIDAAIAESDSRSLGFATPLGEHGSMVGYGAPSSTLHPAYGNPQTLGDENLAQLLNVEVQKFGRTTGMTVGTVTAINATLDVCYDSSCTSIARFEDQLIVTPGTFSAGGDSGSLVVTNDGSKQPVGLLFAGSDTQTIINRIDLVLNRFDVTVDEGSMAQPETDVAITGIDVLTTAEVDQLVAVTVTVENRGKDRVGSVEITLTDVSEGNLVIGKKSVIDLDPGLSATVDIPWTPAAGGLHTLKASHALAGDQITSNDTYTEDINVLLPPSGPQLQLRKLVAFTDHWTTVPLDYDYGDEMVVVCSPNYDLSASGPAMVRVRNASGSSFEVGLGRPWYGGYDEDHFSATVHCMVLRQGVYTTAEDGVKMEAMKLTAFSSSDHTGSWVGQARTYQNSYSRPVVVGQVMSPDTGNPPSHCPGWFGTCEADWSVFWNRGTTAANPPSSSAFYVGRHTGDDTRGRTAETLMYVVIEKGKGTLDGRKYVAALGADTVRGMQNAPPYTYSLSGLTSASVAVVSQAGMDAADGGWAVLYGTNPVTPTRLRLAIEEDWYLYSERKHTTEQVGYIVFE